MNKKGLAILLSAALMTTLIPVTVWGDEIPDVDPAGEEIVIEEAARDAADSSDVENAYINDWFTAGDDLGIETPSAGDEDADALDESGEASPVNGVSDISRATIKWGKSIYRCEYMNYMSPGWTYTVDGKSPESFEPSYTIMLDGKTLKEGTDYVRVTGQSGVVISGINDYSGTAYFYPPISTYYSFAGKNRYETAVRIIIGRGGYNPERLVVVTGEDYPDALAANAYAGLKSSPLVLVKRDNVPPAVEEMLKQGMFQEACREIVVIGGKMDGAIKELKTLLPKATVNTIAGKNRYATAEKVTRQFLKEKYNVPLSDNSQKIADSAVFVTTGQAPADALSASNWSYSLGIPVILAKDGKVSGSAAKALNHFETVYLLGDSKVVKDSIVPKGAKKVRLGGKNRWETSRKISDYFINTVTNYHGYMPLYVPGEDALFADALAAGQFNPVGPCPVILVSEKKASCYMDPTYKQTSQEWPGFFFGSAAKDHGPKGRVGTIYKAVAKNIDAQILKQMNTL